MIRPRFFHSRGLFGVRLGRFYIALLRDDLHRPLFSERNGYCRYVRQLPGGWRLRIT